MREVPATQPVVVAGGVQPSLRLLRLSRRSLKLSNARARRSSPPGAFSRTAPRPRGSAKLRASASSGELRSTRTCTLRAQSGKLSDFQKVRSLVQNCPIDPTDSPRTQGVIDSGGVPAGSGQQRCRWTRMPLPGLPGRAPLRGPRVVLPPHSTHVGADERQRAGNIKLRDVLRFQRIVTFACDGSKFVGYTFSGAFGYTVTRTGAA